MFYGMLGAENPTYFIMCLFSLYRPIKTLGHGQKTVIEILPNAYNIFAYDPFMKNLIP